ncbi:hypothetical protein CMO96_00655 [Candidatus Woesebacteria bacterium]|nr:hypothetical protein [Candidatus Woesebacteria bacterium]
MVLVAIIAIVLSSLILIKSADWVVDSTRRLGKDTKIGNFALASILLALATSLPELFVGISSALSGQPTLSLGNLLGANIADIALVLGVVGVFGGVIVLRTHQDEKIKFTMQRNLLIALFAGLLPIVLLWDRSLSRVDGVLLLLFYVGYVSGFFQKRVFSNAEVDAGSKGSFWTRLLEGIETGKGGVRGDLLRFLAGILVLIVSARVIIFAASFIATSLGVPLILVGLSILAIGTTLPEIAFAYRSIKENAPNLALGTAVGSAVTNASLILGVVVLISPITVAARREYLLAAITFALVVGIFWLLIRTGLKINRLEAGVLLLVYIAFIALEWLGFRLF